MGGGASKGKGGAKPNKWRYDLVALYAKYDMNESGGKNEALGKYTGIDVALKAWKGKENQLLKALKDKLEKLDEAKTKDEQVEDGTQVSFRYQTDAEKDKHWFPGMVNFRKQKALPKGSVPLQIMFENYNSNDFLGEWVYEWPEDVKNWQGFGGVGQHLDDDHRFIVPQKDIIFDNGAFATEYWQTLVRTMNGNPEGPFTEGQEVSVSYENNDGVRWYQAKISDLGEEDSEDEGKYQVQYLKRTQWNSMGDWIWESRIAPGLEKAAGNDVDRNIDAGLPATGAKKSTPAPAAQEKKVDSYKANGRCHRNKSFTTGKCPVCGATTKRIGQG